MGTISKRRARGNIRQYERRVPASVTRVGRPAACRDSAAASKVIFLAIRSTVPALPWRSRRAYSCPSSGYTLLDAQMAWHGW